MKPSRRMLWSICSLTLLLFIIAACGGDDEATPPSTPAKPAATVAPSPTPVATVAPPPTSAATAATTQAPTPGPTATPQAGVVPTPVINSGKRGGTLHLRSPVPARFDTFDTRSAFDYGITGPLFNNLIWIDPYGDGKTLVGDAAETWEVSRDGKEIVVRLRRGIQYHDGTPFTSKDVVYNIERAWKPRSTTMTRFTARMSVMAGVQALDDYSLKVTLTAPSNSFLLTLASTGFQMFPAHIPFPEQQQKFIADPVGTGPFKAKTVQPNSKLEHTRNDAYFRKELPYVDGIVSTVIVEGGLASAAFRAGRIDLTVFDSSAIQDIIPELERQHGFKAQFVMTGTSAFYFNQKEPYTNPKVREAIDLAMSRKVINDLWNQSLGIPYAAPLLMPEIGGLWGYPIEVMKTRPGYRDDKTEDVARAKQLIKETGIDPGSVTINLVTSEGGRFKIAAETFERDLVALGFKVKIDVPDTASQEQRRLSRQFDITGPLSISYLGIDEPKDYLEILVGTAGSLNYAKWSNPELDRFFVEQDQTPDIAKRRQLLSRIQDIVLADRAVLPIAWRTGIIGPMGWVRNYPTGGTALHSPIHRQEQVWLDRT